MNRKQLQRTLETAIEHQKAGRHDEAEQLYRQACQAAPKLFDAWYLAGTLAVHTGRLEEAVDLLKRAVKLDPAAAPAKLFLGMALADLRRFAEAEKPLRAALQKLPNYPEAWENLALTVESLGRLAEAVEYRRRVVQQRPDDAEAHHRLGTAVAVVDGVAAAEPHYRRAVDLKPEFVRAWSDLGQAMVEQSGRLEEAQSCFLRALSLDPFCTPAMNGQALARLRAYCLSDAKRGYDDIIALAPGDAVALSARAMVVNYLPDRSRADDFGTHRAYATAVELLSEPLPARPRADRRLRVGIVSPDLRAHAVACFLEPLLRHLDRGSFELFLYHNHRTEDVMSQRLKSLAQTWRNLSGLETEQAATLIRKDELDLAVDLAGHSAMNGLALFARRIAPVQVTYLGYPNTTGLHAMDFRLVDAVTDPLGEGDAFYTESRVRFAPTAWAYQPPVDTPEPEQVLRATGAAVTFGCFNNFMKVTDETLRVWAHLLARVPASRLVLKSRSLHEPGVAEGVRARLDAAGLPADRVVVRDHTMTLQEHLAAYNEIDVALDTFPYNGTTTTCEALWMGVPVVSRSGDRHVSRVGASLLTAIGHPEWIAENDDAYVRIATELAQDAGRRRDVRARLRSELRASPLLDHAGQAARFGRALEQCWAARCGERATAAA